MKRNWEYKKLTDVCSIQYGYPFESGNFTNEANGMPLIRIRDVKDGQTETYYEGPYPAEYIVHKGEYLIGMDGEFNIAPWKSDDALLNQRVCKITAKEGVFVGFLYRFLIKELKRIEDETPFVTVKHLSAKRLNQVTLPVPPLSEQSCIVAELDLLTGIIDKQNAQLKELDNLAQAIFYDMFGDPIENEKGWYIKTLENIGKCVSGGTPSRKNAEFFEGNINWYSAGELNSLYLEESVEKITEAALKESAAKLCKANSLFIGMYDTAAFKLGITKTEAASNQACANVFPKEDNVIWLYFVLSIMRDEALKCRHGARQKNLNLGFIKSFSVPVPPLALQQSFAEKIQSIEKQKVAIRASITDTQKLLDYTMDKYFG